MEQPILKEIDLSKTTRHGNYELKVGPIYFVMYSGRFYTGTFSENWYGLNFNGIYAGAQYAPPGKNNSSFQRIWIFENAKAMANEAEPEYMRLHREYAIEHRMRSNNQKIDETAPLEAFAYYPKVDAMPKKATDDVYEYDQWDNEYDDG